MDQIDEIKTLVTEGTDKFLGKAAELSDRLDQIETRANRPGAPAAGKGAPLVEEAKSLRDFFETGEGLERKAGINTVNATEGGHALPQQISATVQDQLFNVSPIRRIARIV